jgi:signal transduction histidine kinase
MFNLVPIIDKEGQVERYFGMFRNMTDLIETERRLAIETQKAQEGELLKQSFLTNMSYEIRTPLNTILGFAELFESEHNEADETVFVEEIKRNTNTLLQLINDILFLSKLDADMVEFKHEDFDFAEVFSSFCQIGWSRINPNITAHTENPYNHLVINGDIEHLGKAIQMLCAISASYTKEGTVRAKYEYRRDELVIIIEDTGVGFDAETVNNAFKRFGRDKDEQLCGSGLDLPIIQALIQKMGGSIELQSEKHKGTTAWIFLPCKAKVIDKKRDFIA